MRVAALALELLICLSVLGMFSVADDDDIEFDTDEEEAPKKAPLKPEVEDTVIGIDLGTTFSCVAVMKKSGVEIIPNDQGNRITPSYVAFTKSGRLIGEAAKNEAPQQPTQTMFDIKRLIGRRFSDSTVHEDMKTLPYKILEDEEKLMVQAEVNGEPKNMPPEEISAMILTKMKDTAEAFLGTKVENAVITVPAYFTNSQREATRDAGKIAGLNVMRIINEPTAAALAYGLDKKDESNILVYDLGGGTFDVSLLTVAEGVIEVVSTNGDTHLGGEDFDRILAEYLKEVFEENTGKNIAEDKRAMNKLRQAAEKAKIALSSAKETTVDIESLAGGIDFQETVNRAKFEELNNELFKKTLLPVKQVLDDGNMKKYEVDEIVLVGGSTRIPKVQALLKEFFNGKEPNSGLNPDEAVAYGAAVQGGILSGVAAEDTVLLDITPISIGIETSGGLMDKMIPRNTAIPVKKTKSYMTSVPDTTETNIAVYEGERPLTKHNNLLGQFVLGGFPKAPAGLGHDVTLDVDVNGIMKVTARITASGKEEEMTITKDRSRLTQEQIDEMITTSEEMAEEDAKALARAKAVNEIDIFIKKSENKLGKVELPDDENAKVNEELANAKKLMRDEDTSTDDLGTKRREIEKEVNDILGKYNEHGSADDAEDPDFDGEDDVEIIDEDDDSEEVEVAPAPRPDGEL